MAGTLTISTLSDGTNSTSATNAIKGSAKAWVNFSCPSTTVTINNSYNVSSVTRNAAGDYTITYTTAMPNINYCVNANCSNTGTYGVLSVTINSNSSNTVTAPTTTTTRITCGQPNVGYLDTTWICVSVQSY